MNTNMNGSTALSAATQATDGRLLDHRKGSFRDMGKSNRASRAPTKEEIQQKIQLMIDVNFDRRVKMKVVQVGPEEWLVWCFTEDSTKKCKCAPWSYLPRFHRVRKLVVKRKGGELFLWCDCEHFAAYGFPCVCSYAVINEMTHGQVNIELWKIWEPYYGHESELGQTLMQMQQLQFDNEGMGVRITAEQLKRMQSTVERYPVLYPGTSKEDYDEAVWVLGRPATLYEELRRYRSSRNSGDSDDLFADCPGGGMDVLADFQDTETYVSGYAQTLQANIASSVSSSIPTQKEKNDWYASMVAMIKNFKDDPETNTKDLSKFRQGVEKVSRKRNEEKLNRVGVKKSRCNSLQWAGIDGKVGKPDERCKNALG